MPEYETLWSWFSWWWICVAVMIVFCILCFRRMRTQGMGCCFPRAYRGDIPGRALGGSSESAEEILDRRYALGQIDDEEYERRRRTLKGERG
jgi:uncharacterized membrane protein